jgi:transcriptional regulator with XRE-family HTH domain
MSANARAHRWTPLPPSLGGRLRAQREGAGLSLRQASRRAKELSVLGLSRSTIHALETGQRRPSTRVARLLAEALELPAELRNELLKEAKRSREKEWRSVARRAEWRVSNVVRLAFRAAIARTRRQLRRGEMPWDARTSGRSFTRNRRVGMG